MQKTKRILAIEKIIREARITTQEDLLKKLAPPADAAKWASRARSTLHAVPSGESR